MTAKECLHHAAQSLMANETAEPKSACFKNGRTRREVRIGASSELAARTMSLQARLRFEKSLPKAEAEWETL